MENAGKLLIKGTDLFAASLAASWLQLGLSEGY